MEQKKKVALIGLGTNAANYQEGLLNSRNLELVVVCDLNDRAISRPLYLDIPFLNDFHKIVDLYKIDYVFIVTPPETHFEIARHFLQRKIPVILEKPPFSHYSDSYRLRGLANSVSTKWMTAYHWQFGPEIDYFKSNILPKMGRLIRVETKIEDPYCLGNRIISNKLSLLGAWLDSGSNALSVYNYLFRNLKPMLRTAKILRDTNSNMPYYANVEFTYKKILFTITVDWTKQINNKSSTFVFESGIVDIKHSQQAIFVNDQLVASFDNRPRLANHYFHMLEYFSIAKLEDRKMNSDTLRFLYAVNEDEENF